MDTTWKPDAKVVAAAIAGLIAGALQVWFGIDVFPGFEAGLAVVVAYLFPSTARKPLDNEDGHGPANSLVGLLVVAVLVIVIVKLAVGL